MRLHKPSPAMLVALLALFVALGGSAIAASYVITKSSQIKNGVVTGDDVKNSSLTAKDVKDKSLTAMDFNGSVQGPKGDQGPAGPQGATGPAGPEGPAGADGSAIAAAHVRTFYDPDGNGSVSLADGNNFGFIGVYRVSKGHFCVTLEPELRPWRNALFVNVSPIKTKSGGTPIAYEDNGPIAECNSDEIRVVTELLQPGGGVAPSDMFDFVISAN